MVATAPDAHTAIVYVNQVGGQDELVFDGGSFVVDAEGAARPRPAVRRGPDDRRRADSGDLPPPPARPAASAPTPSCRTSTSVTAAGDRTARWRRRRSPIPGIRRRAVPSARVGRDYCRKNRFTDVVIGLSGGIDSSLVAVIAAEALGPEHVHGVSMPSRYSSDHSKSDAELLARNLGLDYRTITIEPAFQAFQQMLAPSFGERQPGLTFENLQSRCRGQVLMALSNEFGWMVLTTGNKSEMAVGYFTIYGDLVGGYAADQGRAQDPRFDIARHVNRVAGRELIPAAVLTKPPSAELRPDQRDDQSLPPYEVLDPILELYVEHDWTAAHRDHRGRTRPRARAPRHAARRPRRVQALPMPARRAVTVKAFGRDRRLPITNAYRG